jgi:hypothetical protein
VVDGGIAGQVGGEALRIADHLAEVGSELGGIGVLERGGDLQVDDAFAGVEQRAGLGAVDGRGGLAREPLELRALGG